MLLLIIPPGLLSHHREVLTDGLGHDGSTVHCCYPINKTDASSPPIIISDDTSLRLENSLSTATNFTRDEQILRGEHSTTTTTTMRATTPGAESSAICYA